MLRQRICGGVILLLCVGIVLLASQGETVESRDVTPLIFLAPLGVVLIVTREDALNPYVTTKKEEPQWDAEKSRRRPSSGLGKTSTTR